MNIENLRAYSLSLKGVTEDVKWGHDLCFRIGGKMFCVTNLEGGPSVSFKVSDSEYNLIL